ncbi:NCS2 family permease [Alicyclobacillus shizuokensis]|uniref:NCS2 family permease n=1 Tax=Alicyclobacillus shizuokensis TaxID=392014 RepID=UPI00082DB258|nr:NCS2 family permease [Alicyclobacillus shizuokensis]MCL6626073.1 NCS2 family permease [Alicyclobacillus shizuokensis]
METLFRLTRHQTTVGREIVAGITTFVTMAYILFVNPQILSGTGMNEQAVFLATALGAGIVTLLMGLFVNYPIALAPGMGLNAYFATVAASHGGQMSWQTALGCVFISGIVFIILTITKIRQLLVVAVPDSLKLAITVGIGLFITIIGLKDGGIMTMQFVGSAPGKFNPGVFINNSDWLPGLGSLRDPGVDLTFIGLLLIAVLMALRVPGAIIIGILVTTLIGIPMGVTDVSGLGKASWVPDFSQMNFAAFDLASVFHYGLISALFTFTFVELFDTFGTLVGTANKAGLLEGEEGEKRLGRAMLVDATGVSLGALFGTSTITAFVESGSGIAAGGRTGLTGVTTGVLFLLSLFIAPIALIIPSQATAPALVIVGVLMMQAVREIDWENMGIAIPAFLTIVTMPLTYSISNGIAVGFTAFVIINAILWLFRRQEYTRIHWLMIIIVILALWRYIFYV